MKIQAFPLDLRSVRILQGGQYRLGGLLQSINTFFMPKQVMVYDQGIPVIFQGLQGRLLFLNA